MFDMMKKKIEGSSLACYRLYDYLLV